MASAVKKVIFAVEAIDPSMQNVEVLCTSAFNLEMSVNTAQTLKTIMLKRYNKCSYELGRALKESALIGIVDKSLTTRARSTNSPFNEASYILMFDFIDYISKKVDPGAVYAIDQTFNFHDLDFRLIPQIVKAIREYNGPTNKDIDYVFNVCVDMLMMYTFKPLFNKEEEE